MKKIIYSFISYLHSLKKTILLTLIVSVLSISITTTISIMLGNIDNLSISSFGNIRTIGVEAYWDSNCENKTETIDWGTICPGSSQNVTLYIRNVSNIKTTLHLNISDLNPADISEYINLSWDYEGSSLNPKGIIRVSLILSAADESFIHYVVANNIKDFSITIHIVAYG